MRRRVTRWRASMSWCGCARPAETGCRCRSGCPASAGHLFWLVQLLVRIDAPQARLLDPAVEALADEAAPAVLAAPYRRQHPMLQLRADAACSIRLVVERQQFVLAPGLRRDQRGAPARQ